MAKASDENGSNGEGRKLREQTGLDRSFAKLDQRQCNAPSSMVRNDNCFVCIFYKAII